MYFVAYLVIGFQSQVCVKGEGGICFVIVVVCCCCCFVVAKKRFKQNGVAFLTFVKLIYLIWNPKPDKGNSTSLPWGWHPLAYYVPLYFGLAYCVYRHVLASRISIYIKKIKLNLMCLLVQGSFWVKKKLSPNVFAYLFVYIDLPIDLHNWF